MLENTLGKYPNYTVKSFSNGEDFLKNLYLKPSVIVLDHYLDNGGTDSRMNGDEVLKKIQKANPTIPVILLTSQKIPGKTYDFISDGAGTYIQKGKGDIADIEESINQIYANS